MANATIENLKARVEALGYRLYVTDDGTQLVVDHNAPQDKTEVIFIRDSDGDDSLEDWLADREQVSERVRQAARGRIPAEGTVDGENGFYREPTRRERRAAIHETCNADLAIGEALGTLHAANGLAALLRGDTTRDDDNAVLSIAVAIDELTEDAAEFLDRAGGWNRS
jgi:hypothetical protein